MANKYMKRCLILLIREVQIKTTMRYHLTPVRMSTTKVYKTVNAGEGVEKKQTLLHCQWECKLIQPLGKTVWRFLKKLGIKQPYDQAVSLLGMHIYPEETAIEKDTCTPMFIAAVFTKLHGSNLDVH